MPDSTPLPAGTWTEKKKLPPPLLVAWVDCWAVKLKFVPWTTADVEACVSTGVMALDHCRWPSPTSVLAPRKVTLSVVPLNWNAMGAITLPADMPERSTTPDVGPVLAALTTVFCPASTAKRAFETVHAMIVCAPEGTRRKPVVAGLAPRATKSL